MKGETISIVVPLFNEEDNVAVLYERIATAMGEMAEYEHEILFINDGSRDRTGAVVDGLAAGDPRVRVIHFRRNYGQTAALMAGFDHSRGEIIVPMDGDLQNDPADIRALVEKLDEGYSVVSGWRKNRQDAALRRRLPSVMANALISWVTGIRLHDYGCTLKAYRREVIQDVRLFGEMHRFIPIYASWHGGRVTEIPVRHHPRVHGVSKYGLNRIFKVLLDLLVVKFLGDYQTKPIHIFGVVGIFCFLLGLLAGGWALYLKFFKAISLIQTPLPLLVVLAVLAGAMSLLMGLLAEMQVRIYYDCRQKPVYRVDRVVNVDQEGHKGSP